MDSQRIRERTAVHLSSSHAGTRVLLRHLIVGKEAVRSSKNRVIGRTGRESRRNRDPTSDRRQLSVVRQSLKGGPTDFPSSRPNACNAQSARARHSIVSFPVLLDDVDDGDDVDATSHRQPLCVGCWTAVMRWLAGANATCGLPYYYSSCSCSCSCVCVCMRNQAKPAWSFIGIWLWLYR